jgi:hypothetical protein
MRSVEKYRRKQELWFILLILADAGRQAGRQAAWQQLLPFSFSWSCLSCPVLWGHSHRAMVSSYKSQCTLGYNKFDFKKNEEYRPFDGCKTEI